MLINEATRLASPLTLKPKTPFQGIILLNKENGHNLRNFYRLTVCQNVHAAL